MPHLISNYNFTVIFKFQQYLQYLFKIQYNDYEGWWKEKQDLLPGMADEFEGKDIKQRFDWDFYLLFE